MFFCIMNNIDSYASENVFESLCELRRCILTENQASVIIKGMHYFGDLQ